MTIALPFLGAVDLFTILFIIIVIVSQVLSALRRGKVEPETEEDELPSRRAPQQPSTVPAPTPQPQPQHQRREEAPPAKPSTEQPSKPSKTLEEILEELSRGLDPVPTTRPEPVRPRPVPTPPPVPAAPPAPVPAVARVLPLPPRLSASFSPERPASTEPTTPHSPSAWLIQRLRDRTEVQRAIVLSEVLSPPVALR